MGTETLLLQYCIIFCIKNWKRGAAGLQMQMEKLVAWLDCLMLHIYVEILHGIFWLSGHHHDWWQEQAGLKKAAKREPKRKWLIHFLRKIGMV